jgi:hypothetical protein
MLCTLKICLIHIYCFDDIFVSIFHFVTEKKQECLYNTNDNKIHLIDSYLTKAFHKFCQTRQQKNSNILQINS